MLSIFDAMLLSKSKIRSHKIWFATVIIIESFLIAVVLLLLGTSSALENDLEQYSSNSLSGKYLVRVTSPRYTYNSVLNSNHEVWDLSEKLYKESVANKSKIAKQFDIEYDEATEEKPTEYVEGERVFRPWTKYGQNAISDYIDNLGLDEGREALERILNEYDYKSIYEWHNLVANGTITLLSDGKEDLTKYKTASSPSEESTLNGFQVLDEAIYKDFVGETMDQRSSSVPIIVSQKTAEKYLGIENSEGANDYEDVKKNIIGKEYEACYRNNASKQLLFNVEQSKNNELSGIVYENPTIACGPVSIKSDKRSAIEKQYDDRNIAYQKALNEYEEPKQKKIVFKVIGVIPTGNEQDDNTTSLFGLIKDLGKIDISTPLIPKSYYMANQQALSELFNDYSKIKDIYGVSSGYLVEFNDAYTTERFVNEQSCKDSSKGCLDKSAPFYLTYDNKSLILADISSITKTIVLIVAIATVALAIATTIIIILRSISSEKKEISIYKAIGFRRTHLVQVYFTQTLIVSVVTIILATIIAISIGWLANAMFSNILAHELTSIFSIYNQTIKTNIFTVNIWPSIEVIALFISSTAIASIVTTTLSSNNNIVSGLRYE